MKNRKFELTIILITALFTGIFCNVETFSESDGPSCTFLNGAKCQDLISADAAAVAAFEEYCASNSTYGTDFYTEGCLSLSNTTYIDGYCEITNTNFSVEFTYAEYYVDYLYFSENESANCTSAGYTWVSTE
jgi:hypothetical protein